MARNISLESIIGKKGIPTPYIKKVMLSPGTRPFGADVGFGESFSSEGLIVKVELSLTDIKSGERFQWVTDERLQKYLRIRIIESRNPEMTRRMADGGLTAEKLKLAKRKYNFREKILSLRNDKDIDGGEGAEVGTGGVYTFPYEAEFYIPNLRPNHLAYFCSCYMDTRALTRDFGAKFKNKRFQEVQGYVSGDLVIANGQPLASSSVYELPNGDVHPGALHFHEGTGYMAGPVHTEEDHSALQRKKIPNFKVQDERIFNVLDGLEFNLLKDDDIIKKLIPQKIANPARFDRKPNFMSEAFISRDSDGKSNILFSVDTYRILRERGQFGKILSKEDPEVFRKIAEASRISSFKLLRRRVRATGLNTDPASDYKLYDENTKSELIARNSERAAGQLRRRIYKRDRDGDGEREVRIGFVKEIDLSSANRLRTFSCTDFSMSKITAGTYQYVAEVEMDDGTLQFVLDILKKLKTNKSALLKYYNESQLPENYNFNINKFTERFVELNDRRYPQLASSVVNNTPNLQRQNQNPVNNSNSPWNRSVVMLSEAVGSLTNISSDDLSFVALNLHAAINPKTGTPEGLAKFIQAYEKIENEIRRLLNNRGAGDTEFDVTVKSSIHKERFKNSSIKIEKQFKQVFDSDTQKGIGYDFLGGKKLNKGGMREVTLGFYRRRMERENSKYFDGPLRAARIPILDLRAAALAYLSPAEVKYGVGTLKILNSGKSLWNKGRYNNATSIIASMRMDPTRKEISAPIGTAKSLDGPRGIRESLYRNILAANGISIQDPRPRGTRDINKEEVPTEDIIGAGTLSEMEAQAVGLARVEDLDTITEILEEEVRERNNFGPLNSLFLNRLINRDSFDVFGSAQKSGISPGLAGFNLRKSNNILAKNYRGKQGVADKIRNLPNQIKSLFLADQPTTVNKWHDAKTDFLLNAETFEMFRYNHFILQRVEYLSGFEAALADGQQVTRPIFSLMNNDALSTLREKNLLCRMTTYKNAAVYAGTPEDLRLPIRDQYFLIKSSQSPDAAAEDPLEPDTESAARRLSRTTSLDRTSRRIMQILLEKESQAESHYQYTSTIFIKQPRDLIQEGAEIKQKLSSPPTVTTPAPTPALPTPTAPAPSVATGTSISTPSGGGTGGGGY